MERKALRDFTFSDGTFIPKGTHVAAAVHPVHLDEKIYEDPLSFKPFRFAEASEGANDASDAVNNQLSTTSLKYLLFGYGKHAWSVPRIFEHRSRRSRPIFAGASWSDFLTSSTALVDFLLPMNSSA